MIRLEPETLDMLAAEYVLHTMPLKARERFEKILQDDLRARERVAAWEHKVNRLGLAVKPVTPPHQVYQKILQRMGMAAVKPTGIPAWWRTLAWLSMVITLTVSVTWWYSNSQRVTAKTDYIAVLQSAKKQPAWVISIDPRARTIKVQTLATQTLAAAKSFELWIIPGTSAKPVSLGLIPARGSTQFTLSTAVTGYLQNAKALAVTVEPQGGSPTGQPTTTPIFLGALNRVY